MFASSVNFFISRWPVPFLHQSQNSCNYDECENEDELQEQENAQNYQNSSEVEQSINGKLNINIKSY